jgi:Fe-S-cluster-containing dehydrogenase component
LVARASRTVWDGYATVSVKMAKDKDIQNNDIVEIKAANKTLKLAAIVQPGQAADTVGVTLGYGRGKEFGKTLSKVGMEAGKGAENGFTAVGFAGANTYRAFGVSVTKTNEEYEIAKFQKYDLLDDPSLAKNFMDLANEYDRSHHIFRQTSLENYIKNPNAGNEERDAIKKNLITLWDSHYQEADSKRLIRWVMAVDLNKCTGCGSCVVSCNAENNVPVVGKLEIQRHRDMHWMRIDRYYSGDYERPETVRSVFQPMMCQHCANAPCETVCPVLATIHSSDGLNTMAYNRCVGTRYCANNCPYKVRRFNWFKYHNNDNFDFHMNNELGKLVLNPDVTVRFRGVMEKCSFCVQRIQEGKLRAKINAKAENGDSAFSKPKDGDVKTACQQSCPTGAIVFGDLNDPTSEVAKLFRDDRAFTVLEEVKTLPSVSYMTKVNNVKPGEFFEKHPHKAHKAAEHKEEAVKAEDHHS